MRTKFLAVASLLIAVTQPVLTQAAAIAAKDYPSKFIRIVVPYGAGAGPDVVGRIIAGIIISGAAVLGIMHTISGMGYVMTDDAYIESRIHTVAPKVSGTVLKVLVDDNQAVKKGDLLVELVVGHELLVQIDTGING